MAKYKFIGKDGSMGYSKGQVYRGTVKITSKGVLFFPGVFPFNLHKIIIPYQTIKAFEKNWSKM